MMMWAAVISAFSSDRFSGEHTSAILLPVLQALLPGAHPHTLLAVHAGLRKAAHVTEYAILGALLVRALRGEGATPLRAALLAAGLGVVWAASDEMHQAFVPSRTAALGDVGFDTAGVLLGSLVWTLRGRRAPAAQLR
ncbi:MAG: VanZ family protein [bacterium]|nr:VanZ family protein [bacterium]